MSRCDGLSYNGWLYLTPRHVLDDLVGRKMLRPCSNHPTKLRMTGQLQDWVEGRPWVNDSNRKEQHDG